MQRMADLKQQLGELDAQIAVAIAKADAAQEAYESATDPSQEAKWREIWLQKEKDKTALLEERRALQAKLPTSGAHHHLPIENTWSSVSPRAQGMGNAMHAAL